MFNPIIAQISLKASWTKMWAAVSGPMGSLVSLMAIVGMVLIVGGLLRWVWDKRRGGGGASQGVIWAVVIGAILSGPNVVIPLILGLVDLVVNSMTALFKSVG